jgi:hypothetical protein
MDEKLRELKEMIERNYKSEVSLSNSPVDYYVVMELLDIVEDLSKEIDILKLKTDTKTIRLGGL